MRPILIGFLLLVSACNPNKTKPAPGKAEVKSPDAVKSPYDPKKVIALTHPGLTEPYSGKVGSVTGTVTIEGPEAPLQPKVLDQIRPDCAGAKAFYGPLFREGPGRKVADVLVAVTGYSGWVKPASEVVNVTANHCAWDRRTVVVTYGQRIDVLNQDKVPYIPSLLGGRDTAQLVAIPSGAPISLFPPEPGHYELYDAMRLYVRADVLVVQFPTYAVTREDGSFKISGLPVGKVRVSALLPSASAQTEQSIEIRDGVETKLDLKLTYVPAPEPAASASAAPSASAAAPAAAASAKPAPHH